MLGTLFRRQRWMILLFRNRFASRLVYFDRPDDCRYYPVRIEDMIRDGCEMIEPRDLRYLERAQRTLDKIMADSRPPVSEG